MHRSRHLLFIAAVLSLPAPIAAQQPHARADSAAVEVDSVARSSWTANVVHEVPLLADGEMPPDDSPSERPHWQVNVVHEVGFVSRAEAIRARATDASGLRLVVDIEDHRLYALDGRDTLRSATVATASDGTLTFGSKTWRFRTPRGMRTVLAKEREPVWTPPEWHYAEVASEYGFRLRHLVRGRTVRVSDGTQLLTRGSEVGVIAPGDTEFVPLVLDEHIVFDNTLFIPPAGTKNRTMRGELGHYRLKLGNGYQLHGTPYASSIGASVTHGCVRMSDRDIEWLYRNVPVGTKVYLY
jgi:lipoprotein-anchoring transpeptidase ErfK/SrfK